MCLSRAAAAVLWRSTICCSWVSLIFLNYFYTFQLIFNSPDSSLRNPRTQYRQSRGQEQLGGTVFSGEWFCQFSGNMFQLFDYIPLLTSFPLSFSGRATHGTDSQPSVSVDGWALFNGRCGDCERCDSNRSFYSLRPECRPIPRRYDDELSHVCTRSVSHKVRICVLYACTRCMALCRQPPLLTTDQQ